VCAASRRVTTTSRVRAARATVPSVRIEVLRVQRSRGGDREGQRQENEEKPARSHVVSLDSRDAPRTWGVALAGR
jgi:hypothetical protein